MRLAPLYDVGSALVHPGFNHHGWELAVRIDKRGRLKYLMRKDSEAETAALRVDPDMIVAAIDRFTAAICDVIATLAVSLACDLLPAGNGRADRQPSGRSGASACAAPTGFRYVGGDSLGEFSTVECGHCSAPAHARLALLDESVDHRPMRRVERRADTRRAVSGWRGRV